MSYNTKQSRGFVSSWEYLPQATRQPSLVINPLGSTSWDSLVITSQATPARVVASPLHRAQVDTRVVMWRLLLRRTATPATTTVARARPMGLVTATLSWIPAARWPTIARVVSDKGLIIGRVECHKTDSPLRGAITLKGVRGESVILNTLWARFVLDELNVCTTLSVIKFLPSSLWRNKGQVFRQKWRFTCPFLL